MEKERFFKRFSIGLTLLDSLEDYSAFLDKYSYYIDNIYFSLPLGDKFHSRVVFKNLLKDDNKVNLLWSLLKCVQSHKIDLELLFNTEDLTEQDIKNSMEMLQEHQIEVQDIGLLDKYYDTVKKYFPNKRMVYSFNNYPNSKKVYTDIKHHYDEALVARQFIRDNELMSYIKNDLHTGVVLLVNNGCSHTCGGCGSRFHCHDSYFKEHAHLDFEYQYALQSIFPFELHDGYINMDNVALIKLATRNDNIHYASKCIDSYVNNDELGYIESNPDNYLLWSRLQWHTEYFEKFNYNRIVEFKKKIYSKKIDKAEIYLNRVKPGIISLTDLFTISNRLLNAELLARYTDEYRNTLKNNRLEVDSFILGVEACDSLLDLINMDNLRANIDYIIKSGYKAYLEIPRIYSIGREGLKSFLDSLFSKIACSRLSGIIINDEMSLMTIANMDVDVELILGRGFDSLRDEKHLDMLRATLDPRDKHNLFNRDIRAIYSCGFKGIITSIPSCGLYLNALEDMNVCCSISNRIISNKEICPFIIEGNGSCGHKCLCNKFKEPYNSIDRGDIRLGRLNLENVSIVDDIYSTILECRIRFIYSPRYINYTGEE